MTRTRSRWTTPKRKNGTTDLRQIAEVMWTKALMGFHFKTSDLLNWWEGLSEDQAKTVKHYMRELSAEQGVLWGWRPSNQRFATAPHNRPDIASEIIEYARKHWQEAGKDYHLTMEAAYRQGYIRQDARDQGNALYEEFDRRISAVGQNLTGQVA